MFLYCSSELISAEGISAFRARTKQLLEDAKLAPLPADLQDADTLAQKYQDASYQEQEKKNDEAAGGMDTNNTKFIYNVGKRF